MNFLYYWCPATRTLLLILWLLFLLCKASSAINKTNPNKIPITSKQLKLYWARIAQYREWLCTGRPDFYSRLGRHFSFRHYYIQISYVTHPTSYPMKVRTSFLWEQRRRSMKLITHVHSVPSFKKRRSVSAVPHTSS